MEFYCGRAMIDPEKQQRMENVLMGLFTSSDEKVDTEVKGGELPQRTTEPGITPKPDPALAARDRERWRQDRRSI